MHWGNQLEIITQHSWKGICSLILRWDKIVTFYVGRYIMFVFTLRLMYHISIPAIHVALCL